jgi:ElaB/YqjD/DUF883 family membrane-anchored ribosome-binding protein
MAQVFASLGQTADQKLEQIAHTSREKLEMIKGKKIGDLYHDTKGWVKENPFKTVVGALATGVLVGWFLGRK